VIVSILAVSAAWAADDAQVHRITSIVRTDVRTGRLVRSVVVTPKVVKETVIPPRMAPEAGGTRSSAEAQGSLHEIVDSTAKRYEVEPALVHSVVEVESNYNPYALSPKGAEGLMQLMPSTARRFGVTNSFDAQKNVEGGVRYLKYLQSLYGNDLRRVLGAYNAGEGAVEKYKGIPKYPETENYVYQVGKKLGQKRAAAKAEAEKTSQPEQPKVDEHRPVEQYTDAEGRIYLRTR